jgi:hypothetical protein
MSENINAIDDFKINWISMHALHHVSVTKKLRFSLFLKNDNSSHLSII